MNPSLVILLIGGLLLSSCSMPSQRNNEVAGASIEKRQYIVHSADNRKIAVSLAYPASGCRDCTLIVFSHGAAAAPDRYNVLIDRWASSGYVIAAPLHVDSEEYADRADYAPSEFLSLRIEDVATTISAILQSGQDISDGVSLNGRYIAAGHSFGGLIAQVFGGAQPHENSNATKPEMESHPAAVIAVSPPAAIPEYMTEEGWSSISVPMLVVTGTEDVLPGFVEDWEMHLDSYEAAPADLSYAAIFEDMDHYFNGAFGRLEARWIESAESAVDTLNGVILEFLSAADGGAPIAAADWQKRSGKDATLITRRPSVYQK